MGGQNRATNMAKPTRDELAHRFADRFLTADQAERASKIKYNLIWAATSCVEMTPECPEQERALNALDEALHLFTAAIARNGP